MAAQFPIRAAGCSAARPRSTASYTLRGQPEDFDHWAQLGNRGWGWDDVLPFFKQAERWQGEVSELHGRGGFLTTSPMSGRPAVCQAIIDAAGELGVDYPTEGNNLTPGSGA